MLRNQALKDISSLLRLFGLKQALRMMDFDLDDVVGF